MIYIDVETYLKAFKKLPKGTQTWEFRSLPGDPEFYFKVRNNYKLAKKQASSKYRAKFNTNHGIIEVKPTLKQATL